MQEFLQQVESISFKVKQLAKKVELLKKENLDLLQENVLLKEQLQNAGQRTRKTSQENHDQNKEVGKAIVNSTSEHSTAMDMKHELDHYIEEIDKCIDLLKES